MPQQVRTAAKKQPKQERSKETVDALLKATARILVKEGYDRASTNRIAELAGVSIGSLYQYYPSKEALVAALVERHCQELMEIFLERMSAVLDAPLETAARELIRAMIEAHAVNPKLHQVLDEQIPRVGRLKLMCEFQTKATQMIQAYLDLRQEEIRVKDTSLAAFVVVQAVEALTHSALSERPNTLNDQSLIREATDLVVRYLKK